MREWIFDGVMQFVPRFGSRRAFERLGHELVPARHRRAAFVADAARQHIDEEQTTRHLPSAQIADACRTPNVRGKFAFTICDESRRFLNALDRNFGFLRGAFKRVFGVESLQDFIEYFKGNW